MWIIIFYFMYFNFYQKLYISKICSYNIVCSTSLCNVVTIRFQKTISLFKVWNQLFIINWKKNHNDSFYSQFKVYFLSCVILYKKTLNLKLFFLCIFLTLKPFRKMLQVLFLYKLFFNYISGWNATMNQVDVKCYICPSNNFPNTW